MYIYIQWQNNDLQNTTQKTKDLETRTSLKTLRELRCSRIVIRFCSTSGTHRVTLVTNQHVMNEEMTE